MFTVRGNFTPETTKEKQRLVTKLRKMGVRVNDFYTDTITFYYAGNDLTTIANIIFTVEHFEEHEITMHEL